MTQLVIMRPHGHPHAGHQTLDIVENVDLAKSLFEEALGHGFMAYEVPSEGPNRHILSWEEALEADERVIMTPPLVGG